MAHVTVIDVARHAGVSKSTVSNVIRGNAVVAPATRMKVEASVRALGYRPNGVAAARVVLASLGGVAVKGLFLSEREPLLRPAGARHGAAGPAGGVRRARRAHGL